MVPIPNTQMMGKTMANYDISEITLSIVAAVSTYILTSYDDMMLPKHRKSSGNILTTLKETQ